MNSQVLARSALFGALAVAVLAHQFAFAVKTVNNSISNIKNNAPAASAPGVDPCMNPQTASGSQTHAESGLLKCAFADRCT